MEVDPLDFSSSLSEAFASESIDSGAAPIDTSAIGLRLVSSLLDLCPLDAFAIDEEGFVLHMNSFMASSSKWKGHCAWGLFPEKLSSDLRAAAASSFASGHGGLLSLDARLEGRLLRFEIVFALISGGVGCSDALAAVSKPHPSHDGLPKASLRCPGLELLSSSWSGAALASGSHSGPSGCCQMRSLLSARELERDAIGQGLDGVIIESLTKDMRLIWASPEASAIAGMPLEKMKGMFCHEAVRGKDSPCEDCTALKALESSSPQEGEMRSPDGRSYKTRSLPVKDGAGEVNGVVHVAMDITDWRNLEERMREASVKAEELSRAKSDFLACVSHEIRTPMNVIVGMAELLRDAIGQERKDVHEYCDEIGRASEMLLSIFNDIFDYSLLESGDIKIARRRFSPREEFNSVASETRRRAAGKGLEFAMDIDESVPWSVIGDPRHLRRILLNLVSNAVKFTAQGRVRVSARAELVPSGGAAWLKFKVSDTGVGVSTEAQERIFEPFTQEDASIRRPYGGTGLGLAIVKKLLDVMGGSIELRSRKGEGSVFSVSIPLELPSSSDSQELP